MGSSKRAGYAGVRATGRACLRKAVVDGRESSVYGDRELGHGRRSMREIILLAGSPDQVVARSTYVDGGWDDAEFDANRLGYTLAREWTPDGTFASGDFMEAFVATRRAAK